MKVTSATDYSFRLLIYATLFRDRLITSREVADSYGLSHEHIAKIAKNLVKEGYLQTQRGRNGGMSLAKEPENIRLDEIMQVAEPTTEVIDCKAGSSGPCKILPACKLKGILFEANRAFYNVLAQYTLADLAGDEQAYSKLRKLLE